MDILKSMYDFNHNINGIKLSVDEISAWCDAIMHGVKEGTKQVAVNFDDLGEPMAMIVGHEKPNVNGWIQGLVKVSRPANHYNKSALIIAPALDLMINLMESKGYYKYWGINPEYNLKIRFKIMCKHSVMLHRYDTYDEMIIPAGKSSGVKIWDSNRKIHPTEDMTVKLFALRQEFRLPLLKL